MSSNQSDLSIVFLFSASGRAGWAQALERALLPAVWAPGGGAERADWGAPAAAPARLTLTRRHPRQGQDLLRGRGQEVRQTHPVQGTT